MGLCPPPWELPSNLQAQPEFVSAPALPFSGKGFFLAALLVLFLSEYESTV